MSVVKSLLVVEQQKKKGKIFFNRAATAFIFYLHLCSLLCSAALENA